jgi:ribosomal protein L20
LNRKTIAELAAQDAAAFSALVELSQNALKAKSKTAAPAK